MKKKRFNNSFDDSLIELCTKRLNYEEDKEKEHSKKSSGKISKKTYKIKGNNITNEVEIIEDSIKNEIPWRIKYKKYILYSRF